MVSNRKLRIALECRIEDPRSGVGSAILSLAHALSESPIEDQEYTFVVHDAIRDWLEPHVFGPCRLAVVARPAPSRLKRMMKGIGFVRKAWQSLRTSRVHALAVSDGFVESGGFDLVHFTSPTAYLTSVPSIYQPWDLQHAHYPEFFSKFEIATREKSYRAFCEQASVVCMQTEWSKQDVVRQFGIAPGKVAVVRWGSVLDAHREPTAEERLSAREKYKLPEQFFFYPAVTWPHKNHEDIIRAVHLLKTKHGRKVEVLFTGASTEYRKKLDELARDLGVSENLRHLGFVTAKELQSIFEAATAMVFPSRFEGFGLPILEAFHMRLPVISSNASVLPEVAQEGAIYFTPGSPEELADRMLQMLSDAQLRERLVAKGLAVLSAFSIQDTASAFQRLYSSTAAGIVANAEWADNMQARSPERAESVAE